MSPKRGSSAPISIVAVRPSTIQGCGVFATQDLEKDRSLGPALSRYLLDVTMNNPELVSSDLGWWVVTWPVGRFMNHSDKPNCDWKFSKDENRLEVMTKTEIWPNQELTIDYGEIYQIMGWKMDGIK